MDDIHGRGRQRWDLAGDAFLLAVGVFGWCMAAGMVAMRTLPALGEGAALVILNALGSLVLLVAGVGGAAGAWWWHRRAWSWDAVAGAAVGMAVTLPAVALLAPLLSAVLGFLLKPFTTWEFAGPVALLVLVGIAVLAFIVRTLLFASRSEVRHGLVAMRWVGAAGLLMLAAVAAIGATRGQDPEVAEAPIFAVVVGLGSACAVTGADMAGLLTRPRRSSRPSPTG